MDPLSALAIASAVVQMVDFGAKVFFGTVEISRSTSGMLPANIELSSLAQDLAHIAARLPSVAPELSGQSSMKEAKLGPEAALGKLAVECNVLANKLVSDLQRLAVKYPNRRWDTYTKAVKAVWKEKEIKETQTRLAEYRNQLTLHLTALLREEQSVVLKTLRALDEDHKRFNINSRNELDSMKHDILEAIKRVKQAPDDENPQEREKAEDGNPEISIYPTTRGRGKRRQRAKAAPQFLKDTGVANDQPRELVWIDPKLDQKLLDLFDYSHRIQFEKTVLMSLYFETLPVRYGRIKDAHRRAFNWLLGDDLPHAAFDPMLTTWLEKEEGVYWVSGKAGSGKSTLMKFLSNDERVAQALQKWASPNTLIIARHFFWNSGSEEEKSQEGLLRSLLFNILCQCPDLMTDIVSSRDVQTAFNHPNVPWSLSELLRAFDALKAQKFATRRFCFFIDGLDEYFGEHMDVINVLSHMTATGAIKICLSSRPWTPFRLAFGGPSHRMLRLQDFNAPDIRLYAMTMFEENNMFLKLKNQDQIYEELAGEIVDRAEGVFLWVFLVVRSLLRGLSKDDSILSLRKRLRSFPHDLRDFYLQMLNNVEEFYHEQMAHMLQLALHLSEPSPILLYKYLDETNPMPSISDELVPFDASKLMEECHLMERRLNARCSDFLEVYVDHSRIPLSRYRVDFLHRTAKDFLIEQEMQEYLSTKIKRPLDINRYTIRALFAQLKLIASLMPNHDHNALQMHDNRFYPFRKLIASLWNIVEDILTRTKTLETLSGETEEPLLNETERVVMFRRSSSPPAVMEIEYRKILKLDCLSEDGWLLGKAITKGLDVYVASRIQKNPHYSTSVYGRPPLFYAFQARPIQTSTTRLLLQLGACPNQEYLGRSSLGRLLLVLDTVREKPNVDEQRQYTELLDMMITAETKPDQNSYDEIGYMSMIFSRVCTAPDAARLLAKLAQRLESKKPKTFAMSRVLKHFRSPSSSSRSKV